MCDIERSTPDSRTTRPAGGFPETTPPQRRAPGCAGALLPALRQRMTGPGGYYNVGNLLGLGVSIGVPLAAAGGRTLPERLAGDPGALAMSAATLVFLASGELYHRAWEEADGPDPRLNRLADLTAGVGALLLGIGLLMFGHVVLAGAAGGLLAFGKFGSALRQTRGGGRGRPASFPDPFRVAVIAGRFPAMLASGADFWATSLFVLAGGSALALLTPATMLICQLLWVKADLILLHGDKAVAAREPRSDAVRALPGRTGPLPARSIALSSLRFDRRQPLPDAGPSALPAAAATAILSTQTGAPS